MLENYPNPFNPSTRIRFTVREPGRTTLKVFDVLGRVVATLFDGPVDVGNVYEVSFDASRLPSGMYISRLESHGDQLVKKLILMK
jgi:hypothetical protein